MSAGLELAIKRAFSNWRVYAISESERLGRYATVLRDADGNPHLFSSEERARAYIESIPDATEVDYPE